MWWCRRGWLGSLALLGLEEGTGTPVTSHGHQYPGFLASLPSASRADNASRLTFIQFRFQATAGVTSF
jgi:hypothetical protein